MDIIGHPALIIGLGGTGRSMVDKVRRRIRQRVGTDDLPFVEYLYIDTDQGNTAATEHGINIALPIHTGQRLATLRDPAADELELEKRLCARALDRMKQGSASGALGFRQIGSVSFLASGNLQQLQTKVQKALMRINDARAVQAGTRVQHVHPKYLRLYLRGTGPVTFIYFLASAGGGTGSSIFADVGYFVRRAIRNQVYEHACRLIGVVAIASDGSVPETDKALTNSIGVLTELNHYMLGRGYWGAYPLSFPGQQINVEARDENASLLALREPFDYTYIVEPSRHNVGALDADSTVRAMARLEQNVAEFLVSDLVHVGRDGSMAAQAVQAPGLAAAPTLLDNRHEARRPDMVSVSGGPRYCQSYPAEFMTLGATCRELPVAYHHVLAYGQAIRGLVARWTMEPSPQADGGPDDLGHAQANTLIAQWVRKAGLLAQPKDYLAVPPTPRHREQDPLLAALLQVSEGDAVRTLLRQEVAPPRLVAGQTFDAESWLRARQDRVNALCLQVPNTPDTGRDGWAYAVVRDRREALGAWDRETGYPRQLGNELLTLAFDPAAGPGVALACVRHLLGRLQQEVGLLRTCLEQPMRAPHAGSEQVRGPRPDWLLTVALGVERPAADVAPAALDAWHHANRKLVALVLDQKRLVLNELVLLLERMLPRFENLRRYYGQWGQRAPGPQDAEFQLTDEERQYVLVDDRRIAELSTLDDLRIDLSALRLYHELQDALAQKLPEMVSGRQALLLREVPIDLGTEQPDFSYLEDIEEQVFEAIGKLADGPHELDVVALLRRKAQAAGQSDKQLAELLQKEAAPLLQLIKGDTSYQRDCRFELPMDYWELTVAQNARGGETLVNCLREAGQGCVFPDQVYDMYERRPMRSSAMTIVRTRGGIVTPMIAGYETNTSGRLVSNAGIPPFVHERINPPMDPERLGRSARLLLGGLVLGKDKVFKLKDPGFLFEYDVQAQGQPAAPRSVLLSRSFPRAQEQLAKSDTDMNQLELKLKGVRNVDRDGVEARLTEVFRLLSEAVRRKTPDKENRRLDVWATADGPEGVYLQEIDYTHLFTHLSQFVAEFGLLCDIMVEHPTAVFVRKGDPRANGAAAPEDAFYCKQATCSAYLGVALPAYDKVCPHCHNDPQYVGGR